MLIMIDTVSAEHIGTYGYVRDTMPKTTAFFEQGAIFTDANSLATWTLPSFNGLYFSTLPSNILYSELEDNSRPNLQSEMRAGGVTIRAVRPSGENFIFDAITRLYEPEEIAFSPEGRPVELGQKRLAELEASDKPFFLLIHTFEAHDPYKPEDPFDKYFDVRDEHPIVEGHELRSINSSARSLDPEQMEVFRLRYDQQLAQTDEHIAGFLNSLPKETLKDTVIILSSDHGEAFGEHGKVWHGNNGLFEEELHVPLMMRVPGVGARRVNEAVSLMDLAPTILSLMRLPVPETFDGRSLVPLLSGQSLGSRVIPSVTGMTYFRVPGSTTPPPVSLKEAGALGQALPLINPSAFGVRDGSLKLFVTLANNKLHFYDLATDPEERTNLAEDPSVKIPEHLSRALTELQQTTP